MEPLIIAIIIATFALAFGIGTNDETMATVVGSGALSLNKSVLLGGGLALIGTIFLSEKVGKNIGARLFGTGLKAEYTAFMVLAIIISTTIWLVVASQTGAPISTTHSVVGSVLGVALFWSILPGTNNNLIASLNWEKLGQISLGWILSPLFGFLSAYIIQWGVQKFMISRWERDQKIGFLEIEKTERGFQYLLLIFIALTQLSRGGNDSANALGIFYDLMETGEIPAHLELILTSIAGLMIALGLILIGRIVIKNVGFSLVEIRPSDAFAIQSASSLVIFLCTLAGWPISGSHVLIFAIIGSGIQKGEKPNRKSLKKMIVAWLVTFPIAALLSGTIYAFFFLIGWK
jgi:PiT family inorganic phosphate transporter